MPALIAVDPGEAVLRIAAGEEAFDDVFLDATPEAAARPQLRRMPGGTLIQGRRARLARPVDPPTGGLRSMRAPLHARNNALQPQEGARPIQPLTCFFVSKRNQASRDPSEIPAAVAMAGVGALQRVMYDAMSYK